MLVHVHQHTAPFELATLIVTLRSEVLTTVSELLTLTWQKSICTPNCRFLNFASYIRRILKPRLVPIINVIADWLPAIWSNGYVTWFIPVNYREIISRLGGSAESRVGGCTSAVSSFCLRSLNWQLHLLLGATYRKPLSLPVEQSSRSHRLGTVAAHRREWRTPFLVSGRHGTQLMWQEVRQYFNGRHQSPTSTGIGGLSCSCETIKARQIGRILHFMDIILPLSLGGDKWEGAGCDTPAKMPAEALYVFKVDPPPWGPLETTFQTAWLEREALCISTGSSIPRGWREEKRCEEELTEGRSAK